MSGPGHFPWVADARLELEQDFAPRARRALDTWPVAVSEITVAGIPCQQVLPQDTAPKGTLLYFFGGGHMSGQPEYDLPITAALCVQAGLRVIAPRYALAPENAYPTAVTQASAVWSALCTGPDGPPMLMGESAGGNLALALMQTARSQGRPLPPRLALLSPWTDMTDAGTAACAETHDPYLPSEMVIKIAHPYLQGQDPADPLVSPALADISADWPATLITTGSLDALRPTVLAFHDKLKNAGAPVTLIDAPDMWHVFEVYDEAPAAAETLTRIADFLSA